ncbi:hypothetical protein TEA_029068 [Camellia sinensis var. sinensis]|uniref:Protein DETOXIFICATION n=1 Tax=Camellia sinensis var. sinensis TaxID=542762 RepID=A0A4S4E9T7_CAMSN|nr:hypothetical protein TEA_029068 [Camellia sinensis var. sinensis]
MPRNGSVEESKVPLLDYSSSNTVRSTHEEDNQDLGLTQRVLIESKKLWHIVGPSMVSRIASFSMFVITQSSAGHLGDLELAAISISSNVILGFNFGLLLGMASALETLCGQAYGAKKYQMLGIYMQRSWIVLFICGVILLPFYIFATPILKLLGQPSDIAELSGVVSIWMIPLHFSFVFQFPLQRFLQSQLKTAAIAWVSVAALAVHSLSQLKTAAIAWVSVAALAVHSLVSWWFVYRLKFDLVGVVVTLNFSWWISVFGLFAYVVLGGCPLTWIGFSIEAFSGLWEFVKLSAASGVMLCLENWYYRILVLMTGNLQNAEIAVDALSICRVLMVCIPKDPKGVHTIAFS